MNLLEDDKIKAKILALETVWILVLDLLYEHLTSKIQSSYLIRSYNWWPKLTVKKYDT